MVIIQGSIFDLLHNNSMLRVLIRIEAILMIIHNIRFHDKNKNISLNICFLELSGKFCRDSKNEFELSMVNELSMFELSRT